MKREGTLVVPDDAKYLVLDTSVLINDPEAVEHFGANIIVVPIWVISELDELKRQPNGRGAAARMASNAIYQYLSGHKNGSSLNVGIPTKAGGMVMVATQRKRLKVDGLKENTDRFIVEVAHLLHAQNMKPQRRQVELVTNDVNQTLIASAAGIYVGELQRTKVVSELEDLYTGTCECILTPGDGADRVVEMLFSNHKVSWDQVKQCVERNPQLYANEGFLLRYGDQEIPCLLRKHEDEWYLYLIEEQKMKMPHSLRPKNLKQVIAYALLTDPKIQLVTLTGVSGGGKTLLSMLAALDQIQLFEQVMVFRPVVEPGESLGYLPGTMEEKFAPWALPIADNVELILSHRESSHKKLRRAFRSSSQEEEVTPRVAAANLVRDGSLVIEPINHLRGRSLHQRFIVFDEGQNFTWTQIKLGVTRAGQGTKVVVTGDLRQVDLDVHSTSSGLARLVESMKGDPIYGHVQFDMSERSYLAEKIGRM